MYSLINVVLIALQLIEVCIGNLLTGITPTFTSVFNNNQTYTGSKGNDLNLNTKYVSTSDSPGNQWWQIQFASEVTIRSIFVVTREDDGFSQSQFDVTVGDLTPPTKNPICYSLPATGEGGWFACSTSMTGIYLGVSRSIGSDHFQFKELAAYSDYFIQSGIVSGNLNADYLGSNAMNAIKTGLNFIIYTPTYVTAASGIYNTTSNTEAILSLNLKAEILISQIVIVSNNHLGQVYYNIRGYRSRDNINVCQQFNVDLFSQVEFDCNDSFNILRIQVSKSQNSGSTLSIVSVGLLSQCDCQYTYFQYGYVPNYSFKGVTKLSVDYAGAIKTTNFQFLDSVSLTCGDYLGKTFCNAGKVEILYMYNNVTNTQDSFITYNKPTASGVVTLSINPSNMVFADIGTHFYEIKLTVPNLVLPLVDQYIFQKSFNLTIIDTCLTTVFSDFTLNTTSVSIELNHVDYIDISIPTDSESLLKQDPVKKETINGYNFCGARVIYVIDYTTNLEIDFSTSTNFTYLTDTSDTFGILSITPSVNQNFTIGIYWALSRYSSVVSAQLNATITVVNPCFDLTTLEDWVIDVTSYDLMLTDIVQFQINEPKDSASDQNTPYDGYSLCGPRQLILLDTLTGLSESYSQPSGLVYYDQAKFVFTPTNRQVYNYTLQYTLLNYPTHLSTIQYVEFVVDRCFLNTSFNTWYLTPQQSSYNVWVGQSIQFELQEPTNSVSLNYGDLSGYTFCGTSQLYFIDYSIGDTSLVSNEVSTKVDMTYKSTSYIGTLNITSLSVGEIQLGFLYKLDNYLDLPGSEINNITLVTLQPPFNTLPSFVGNGPSYLYQIVAGSELVLNFILADAQSNDFDITVTMDSMTKQIVNYQASSQPGGQGTIDFQFKTSIINSGFTSKIKIAIQEKFDASTCPFPLNSIQYFNVKVVPATVIQNVQPPKIKNSTQVIQKVVDTFLPQFNLTFTAKIKSIDRIALVTVEFDQEVEIDRNSFILGYNQNSQEQQIIFNWTHDSNATKWCKLQLYFSKPLSVSVGDQLDELIIYFRASQWDTDHTKKLEKWVKLTGALPTLVSSAKELKSLTAIADTLDATSRYLFYIFLVCNVLFSFALGQLWGTFQTLQVIIAMPLLLVKMPANVLIVFQGFNDIVNLKIVDPKVIYDATIGKLMPASSTNITYNNATRLLQVATNQTTNNQSSDSLQPDNLIPDLLLGVLALCAVLILVVIIVFCIKFVYPKLPKVLQKLLLTLKSKLMWSSVLRYMTQSYLNTNILCAQNMYNIAAAPLKSQILTPITFLYLILLPAGIYYLLWRNRATLHTPETKSQIGSLYMNYETDKKSVLHFTMFFLYRRLVFAMTIAFLQFNVVMQVYVSIVGSILLLSYVLKWEPMEADSYDFLAIFNEIVLLISCYLILLYTDYVPDPALRYTFGNVFLYLLYINFGINIFLLVVEIGRIVTRNCKRNIAWKKQRQAIKQKIANRQKDKEMKKYLRMMRKNRSLIIVEQQKQILPMPQLNQVQEKSKEESFDMISHNQQALRQRCAEQSNILNQSYRILEQQPSYISELSAINISQDQQKSYSINNKNLSIEEDDYGPVYRVAKIQPGLIQFDISDNKSNDNRQYQSASEQVSQIIEDEIQDYAQKMDATSKRMNF